MRIDAHQHLWDLSVRAQDWITGPAMAPLDRSFVLPDLHHVTAGTGIGATVLVQTVTVAEETPEFLVFAEASEIVAAVVGWTDLTAPDIADTLAGLRAGHGGRWLRGIRHQVQGEADPRWLCRPEVRRGLAAVAAAGLSYDLLTLPHQLPAAIETVKALPELSFVLDHCSKPPIASGELEPWASDLRALAALPNVTCKLSGLVTEADWAQWTVEQLRPYTEVVLAAFGPERVMFGSDWPVCLLAAPYATVLETAEVLTDRLTPTERAAVFGDTARRVYAIEQSSEVAQPLLDTGNVHG
ncbi:MULTISPECIES: amidohydrolase [unclassified Crossiella]|uniref:amidohydrolase family protein n=1 Tax=unclassified Crossiella TaxID=2620835 RepID=UPI001FFEC52A|nr:MULTISPECIES: amidohydrolase family protein [unclassified Crossiella]MCK2237881.1 amidohydrolase family protein [Crossiella sp. S99.2]MCK2255167.1 amidohydrolase family protein [Crossiella sp. S99.1]